MRLGEAEKLFKAGQSDTKMFQNGLPVKHFIKYYG